MRVKPHTHLTLSVLKKLFSITPESEDIKINAVCTNSKIVEKDDLFIAISGENFNGEDFVSEARDKGAYILSTKKSSDICVTDTKEALLKIASYVKDSLKQLREIIAITGSVGKTTTKNVLSRMLSPYYRVHATHENYNNEIGVAHTLLTAPVDTEILVVELGMNHLGEISRLSKYVGPTLSVITSVGTAHIGNLGSKELIAKAKLEILDGMSAKRVLIPFEEKLLSCAEGKITVSINNPDASYFLNLLSSDKRGSSFSVCIGRKKSKALSTEHFGIPYLSALIFSVGAMSEIGVENEKIISSIKEIDGSCMRGKIFALSDFFVYDDTYSASYEAVINALETVSHYNAERSCVLGDMLELGSHTEALHRQIGKSAYEYGYKRLYLFGVYAPFIALGAKESGMSEDSIFINTDITSPQITANQIIKNHTPGETILFKASHGIMAGRICEEIKKKINGE